MRAAAGGDRQQILHSGLIARGAPQLDCSVLPRSMASLPREPCSWPPSRRILILSWYACLAVPSHVCIRESWLHSVRVQYAVHPRGQCREAVLGRLTRQGRVGWRMPGTAARRRAVCSGQQVASAPSRCQHRRKGSRCRFQPYSLNFRFLASFHQENNKALNMLAAPMPGYGACSLSPSLEHHIAFQARLDPFGVHLVLT